MERSELMPSCKKQIMQKNSVKMERTHKSVEIIYKNRTRLFASLSAGTKVWKFFEY